MCMCACVRASPASLSRQFQSDFKYVDEQNEQVEKHRGHSVSDQPMVCESPLRFR